MIRNVKEFTVVRSHWLRGFKDGTGVNAPSKLRNSYGHMCCMGFYAEACGVPTDRLCGYYTLNTLNVSLIDVSADAAPGAITQMTRVGDFSEPERFIRDGEDGERHDGGRLCVYGINDDRHISEEERELRLTKALALQGITVHFVDE